MLLQVHQQQHQVQQLVQQQVQLLVQQHQQVQQELQHVSPYHQHATFPLLQGSRDLAPFAWDIVQQRQRPPMTEQDVQDHRARVTAQWERDEAALERLQAAGPSGSQFEGSVGEEDEGEQEELLDGMGPPSPGRKVVTGPPPVPMQQEQGGGRGCSPGQQSVGPLPFPMQQQQGGGQGGSHGQQLVGPSPVPMQQEQGGGQGGSQAQQCGGPCP